jgi:release factor glutamine methyltransferase
MLALGREFLERKGIVAARLEAEILVAHACGSDRLALFLDLERPPAPAEVERARELLVRRARGEPCAYLVGAREFYGRRFAVGPGVLIPRPETELLVDVARAARRGLGAPRVLDLGTGSGCLAITLALELPGASVLAVDVSAAALGYARENAARLGAGVEWREQDAFEALAAASDQDLIVSNPPYVDPDSRELAPEVRAHEPPEALFAPAGDVDAWARRLAREAPAHLAPGGRLLVELGFDQADRLAPLAAELGVELRFHRDLGGVRRVLEVAR